MKICIVSDSHDNSHLLETAVREAQSEGTRAVLHCGDVVAPGTLEVLKPFGLPVHVMHGNNSGDLYMMARIASAPASRVHYHGQDAGIELAGRCIFLFHCPHYAAGMATTDEWDLVCCGHDHKADIRLIDNMSGGRTLPVNPGTVGGIKAPATYIVGNLDSMEFPIREIALSCRREDTAG